MSVKGISPAAEPNTIVLGAGAVYVDFGEVTERAIGATAGGSEFDFGRTIEPLEVDAGQGEVKGMHKKTEIIPMLTMNLLELSYQGLQDFIPGVSVSDQTSYYKVLEALCMTDSDYFTNIAIVADDLECNQRVAIIIKNAYVSNSPTLTFEKNTPVVPEIEFKGTFGRDALDTVPYEIRYYQDDETAPTVTPSPADAASGVAVDATLTFTFSEAMDISTLTAANLILMEQDGTAIPYTISINPAHTVATLVQTSNLPASSDIIMMATVGCRDIAGNALAAASVVNFTTA